MNNHTPDGIYIEQTPQHLRITRTWAKVEGYIMFVFACVVVCAGSWLFFLPLGQQPSEWLILFVILMGLIAAYVALAQIFNHTLIEINVSRLLVQHTPLFWLGGKKFAVRDILELEPQIKKSYAKQGIVHIYQILVVHQNGKKVILLSGPEMTEAQMIFIIDALNAYLQTLRHA